MSMFLLSFQRLSLLVMSGGNRRADSTVGTFVSVVWLILEKHLMNNASGNGSRRRPDIVTPVGNNGIEVALWKSNTRNGTTNYSWGVSRRVGDKLERTFKPEDVLDHLNVCLALTGYFSSQEVLPQGLRELLGTLSLDLETVVRNAYEQVSTQQQIGGQTAPANGLSQFTVAA